MKLKIGNINYNIEFNSSENAQIIKNQLPIRSVIENRWGDEIYFYTNFGLELSPDAKEIMEIGDIVYRRSKKSEKEAIAIFFGNTPKGDGDKPRAASECDVIGKITDDFSNHGSIQKGDNIELTS